MAFHFIAGRVLPLSLVAFLTVLPGCTSGPAEELFAPRVGWPTGLAARALAVVDADGAEVALAFSLEGQVGLLDAADGDLNPWAAEVGASPISLAALGDGSGGLQLASANAGDATLTLLAREPPEGDPSPAGLEARATASLELRPKHVCAADLDGDGRDEAIVTLGLEGEAHAGVEVWRTEGDALVSGGPRWTIAGAFSTGAGDVDGDGAVDVIAVLPSLGAIAWASVDANGGLAERGRAAVCDSPRAAAVLGDHIAVACRDGLALVRVAETPEVERVPVAGNLYDLVASDVDGDGSADLAAVDVDGDAVLVFLARADGGLSAPTLHPVGIDPIALVAADLGGDGDVDLVVSAFGSRTIDVLENSSASHERTSP